MAEPRWREDAELVRPDGVETIAIARVLRVPPEAAGTRVDVFLSQALRSTSRTRAKLIAATGAYTTEGRRLKPSERLRAEMMVALWRLPVDEVQEDVDLPVVFEDEHLLVLDKPPGITVHPTARHYNQTVTKILETQRPGRFLSLIHRLDRETSGILLVAKTPAADREFKMMLEEHAIAAAAPSTHTTPAISKTYLAICWGDPPEGVVDSPLEPDTDNTLRVKMRVARPGTGLPARTEVAVLDRRPGYSLARCELSTGRQHQIRIHLASVGCAVVGDKLYGPDDRLLARAADGELDDADLRRLELSRHALHAHRYCLPHAITGKPLVLESPLPSDLHEFWHGLAR